MGWWLIFDSTFRKTLWGSFEDPTIHFIHTSFKSTHFKFKRKFLIGTIIKWVLDISFDLSKKSFLYPILWGLRNTSCLHCPSNLKLVEYIIFFSLLDNRCLPTLKKQNFGFHNQNSGNYNRVFSVKRKVFWKSR